MNVLLIVAHPDDEILGAGATAQKLINQGARVAVLTLGMSSATREEGLLERQEESHRLIGIERRYCGELEAMKFQNCDRYKTVQVIEAAIEAEEPDWIITHFPGDLHNDHRITAELTAEAARLPQRGTGYNKPIRAIYHMEILSSTDWNYGTAFPPNVFCPVTEEQLKKKVQAVEPYDRVLRAVPHPRNRETIFSLARYRGGQCGEAYAEAFYCSYMNIRGIVQ